MSFDSFSNSLFNLLIYINFVSCFSRREFSVLYSFYFCSVNLFIKPISYVAAPSNEFVELGLENQIMATYDGLSTLKAVSITTTKLYGTKSNFELWCNAGDLALDYGNITNIIDSEVDSEKTKNTKRILKSFGINFLTKL